MNMSNIDVSRPVRLKNPYSGEESLVFQVVNLNEETGRCYIRLVSSLPGLTSELAPQELVSIDDLINID